MEQLERIDAEAFGDPFDGAQREIAFPSFNAADVGPMDAEQLGKGFLGEPPGLAENAQVLAELALQVAFHR